MAKQKPSSGPANEKPKAITIERVKRTRRFIFIDYTQGDSGHKLKEVDNPLPSFNQALDALGALVATVCHFPPAYCETDLRVVGATIGERGGVQTVSIIAQKSLSDASKALPITTPPRMLGTPTKEGSYSPPLSAADHELVATLINEAKAYVMGERAQGQLPLDGGDEDDEGDGDTPGADDKVVPLPGFEPDKGSSGKAVPRKKRGGK